MSWVIHMQGWNIVSMLLTIYIDTCSPQFLHFTLSNLPQFSFVHYIFCCQKYIYWWNQYRITIYMSIQDHGVAWVFQICNDKVHARAVMTADHCMLVPCMIQRFSLNIYTMHYPWYRASQCNVLQEPFYACLAPNKLFSWKSLGSIWLFINASDVVVFLCSPCIHEIHIKTVNPIFLPDKKCKFLYMRMHVHKLPFDLD